MTTDGRKLARLRVLAEQLQTVSVSWPPPGARVSPEWAFDAGRRDAAEKVLRILDDETVLVAPEAAARP